MLSLAPPPHAQKIRHCNPLRIIHHTRMTVTKSQTSFRALIEPYSARHIAAAIGCSLATAYDWRSGRRAPPVWTQAQILSDLATYTPPPHGQKTA